MAGQNAVEISAYSFDPGFLTVAVLAGIPMGIELTPRSPLDRRVKQGERIPTAAFPPAARVTLADALSKITAMLPGYQVDVRSGVVTVAPTVMLANADHFLNRRVNFEVTDLPLGDAITRLLMVRGGSPGAAQVVEAAGGGGSGRGPSVDRAYARLSAALSRHVTLAVSSLPLREAFNRLATQSGEIAWEMKYQDGMDANEHSCALGVTAVGSEGGYKRTWLCR